MNPIPDAAENVPRMFRAQIDPRCQLQRLQKNQEPHVLIWTNEWKDFASPDIPEFDETVEKNSYRIKWRLVTNSGQDDDLIRPVIGAGGWPFIPGSSMKGAFRRVCSDGEQRDRYCGKELEEGDFLPGILRFHGGYPTNFEWKNSLIDLAHPQQLWQVKDDAKSGGAFAQISLKQTELQFGISSLYPLSKDEWNTIWKLWEQALSNGLGSRVSSCYGLFEGEVVAASQGDILYRSTLKGQGLAPTLLGCGIPEFRPNIFKAALRGHALRLFGGFVTWDSSAESLVETLFGGIQGESGTQGLLGLDVRLLTDEAQYLREVDTYTGSADPVTFYDVECEVVWRLIRLLPDSAQVQALKKLIQSLMQFAMLLGGFGKSWRRADHSIFRQSYTQHPIGCHWQWSDESDNPIRNADDVQSLIDAVRDAVWEWIEFQPQGFHPRHEARLMKNLTSPLILRSKLKKEDTKTDRWREVWRSKRVEVWSRESNGDSKVIDWLHDKKNYRAKSQSPQSSKGGQQSSLKALQRYEQPKAKIYRTTVSGYVGEEVSSGVKETRVGLIWHRMYPLTGEQAGKYLELLTFFPNPDSEDTASAEFQTYLNNQREFRKLWGD